MKLEMLEDQKGYDCDLEVFEGCLFPALLFLFLGTISGVLTSLMFLVF